MKKKWVAAALVVLVSGLAWKSIAWLDRPARRSQLVSGVVREQRDLLRSQPPIADIPSRLASEPPALRSWLVYESLRGRSPTQLQAGLARLIQSRTYAPEVRNALSRWSRELEKWSNANFSDPIASDQLLERGERNLFDADGYHRIARTFDASVGYLWAIQDLTEFIDQNPRDARIPEAVFLLGSAFYRLGESLPQGIREDRLLNLVFEYFPDSHWANHANAFWTRGRLNET